MFSETKLEIFTSLVYFLGALLWSGTITNRSQFAVARSGLKSKQARKNSEVIFNQSHKPLYRYNNYGRKNSLSN